MPLPVTRGQDSSFSQGGLEGSHSEPGPRQGSAAGVSAGYSDSDILVQSHPCDNENVLCLC